MVTSPLVVKATVSFRTGLPFTSASVAVAVECDVPSAVIDAGFRPTAIVFAGPYSVRTFESLFPPPLAVMVSLSAVDDALMVLLAVPSLPVLALLGENVTSPLVPKPTLTPGTPLPLESVTVAVAVDVEVPSAAIEFGLSVRLNALAGPAVSVRGAV